jgi:branched-subunit amino acid transport protein
MTALLAMVCLGLASWVLRSLFIVLVPAERLPAAVRSALAHLPPAVLAALVSVEVAGALGGLDLVRAAFVLTALVVAGVVVRLTRSMGLGVAIGLVAALLLDLVLV